MRHSIWLAAMIAFSAFLRPESAVAQEVLADAVKREFLHAWNGYKRYAWGHDALQPLSKTPHDWYGASLYMTPVDAYDVLLLMGLKSEAAETKQLILDSLRFDKDIEVQSFEVTIRLLGGLLSAYQLDGDKRFLDLAHDLGNRLLPIFDTPTGMPYRYVHLQTGKIRDSLNNPAEIGTCLLEFGTLSKLTGNPIFYDKAKRALVELFKRRSKTGLVGTVINVESGEWVRKTSHIGGAIDSYYEYLLKAWLLFDDQECKEMWEKSIGAVNTYLADTLHNGFWYGRVDMENGKLIETRFGSLEAFFPAVLALSGDLARASKLQESCYRMWTLHGIEPERIDYASMQATAKEYYLRPEIIESAYYLFHFTKDSAYVRMGENLFRSLVKYCRTEAGYAYLSDVITKEKADGMESFFFAETLKYLYLLFSPPATLPFNEIIFTTEAHPLRNTWRK
ncbi:MAG: glycoside hydrolase family 47 protein [Ignavibacteriae bacterium]|nr:glycoside hydrolase family 47 protein [Ignavibacteriota bacterium]